MKLAVIVVLISVVGVSHMTSGSGPVVVGRLEISAPDRISAGAPSPVLVRSDGPDGTLVDVAFFSAVGTAHQSAPLAGGRATLAMPPEFIGVAGLVTVVAAVGGHVATTQVAIEAGPIVEPVVPLLGARSIVADATDQAMVAVIAEDAFGNPQPDGVPIEINLARENGERLGQMVETRGGVAWAWLPSSTDAGQTMVGARSGVATGPAAYLHEVPGSPVEIEVSADRLISPADGRALIAVETSELVDAYNNRLLDGTAVVFTTVGPAGRSTATSVTIGGRATTLIHAPETAGNVVVTAATGGRASVPLSIRFEALDDPGNARVIAVEVAETPETVEVLVGPILGQEGAYVPSGTRVSGSLAGTDATCLTEGGRCRLNFPSNAHGFLIIEVMGREVVTQIGDGR